MKTNTLVNIVGIVLLTVIVTIAVLATVYILQHTQVPPILATVSWNG